MSGIYKGGQDGLQIESERIKIKDRVNCWFQLCTGPRRERVQRKADDIYEPLRPRTAALEGNSE
jgi:hypothetical protein